MPSRFAAGQAAADNVNGWGHRFFQDTTLYTEEMERMERTFLEYSAKQLQELGSRIETCLNSLKEDQVWARGGENENAMGNLVSGRRRPAGHSRPRQLVFRPGRGAGCGTG